MTMAPHPPHPVVAAICLTFMLSGATLAQTPGAPAEPCRPDPTTPNRSTLTECDGELKPPATGDGEIVEPAPDTGKMPVIPPSDVPQQQSGETSSPESDPAETAADDYSISEIVDAVSRGSSTAIELENLADPDVLVQDISLTLNGRNASLLDTSLVEHAAGVETLRRAVSDAPVLKSALEDNGLTVSGVIAARIEGKLVTLFAR